MKLQRVSGKLAKRLRDIGFNIMCDALYRPYCGEFEKVSGDDDIHYSPNVNPLNGEPPHNDWVSAPTLELARMWFCKNISHIEVNRKLSAYRLGYCYRCRYEYKGIIYLTSEYDTHDEALEAGLLIMCDYLKK